MPRSGVEARDASMTSGLPIILWLIQFITLSVYIYAITFLVASMAVKGDLGVLGPSYLTILIFFFLLSLPKLTDRQEALFITTLLSIEVYGLAWRKRDVNNVDTMLTGIIGLTLLASPETEDQRAPGRQGPDRIFDRRGIWIHNPAVVSTGARSPGLGPSQQSSSAEESSVKNMMASMAWGADTPMHGQGIADEHSKKTNSGNNSGRNSLSESLKNLKNRSNSLSGSLKKATSKLFGRGSVPPLESYLQQPPHGMPLHGCNLALAVGKLQEVPLNDSAPGQQPQSGMVDYPPMQYRQENDVYAPQQQNIFPYQTSIDSVLVYAQNMMPYTNGYGAPMQQPSQGDNGPYNQPASNMASMQTQPGQGSYLPNGQDGSTPQLQPALQFQPIHPAPTALNNTSDVASKAGCFEHLISLTQVVGTQAKKAGAKKWLHTPI
ncbi:hypothetical protein IFR04_007617 [Cadophora malorum]|uniref:Uncharacterized protein n=1 Tax=Cadophora malorum TaxID=108018 RepID=A0A8H7TCR8_9HELO|nr:hypothetical protein IFR04_007617 [Cadophora malorum]